METYNSYKQNKEQFMTEIQNKPKNQLHRRFISSNLKIELEQREKEEEEQENCHDYSRYSMEEK